MKTIIVHETKHVLLVKHGKSSDPDGKSETLEVLITNIYFTTLSSPIGGTTEQIL